MGPNLLTLKSNSDIEKQPQFTKTGQKVLSGAYLCLLSHVNISSLGRLDQQWVMAVPNEPKWKDFTVVTSYY